MFGKSIGAGVLIMLLASSLSMAADSFNMDMNVTGTGISFNTVVEEDPWDNSEMDVGTTNESAINQVNIDNTGSVAIDVKCAASDSVDWTIESTIGADEFRLDCKENAAGAYAELGTTAITVYNNLGVGVNKDFRFKFYMPSSSTAYGPEQSTVTFSVVAH